MTTRDAPSEVLDRIKKLLNLAAKNSSEGEASLALAKAQELMEQWNLTEGQVERETGGSGRREEELVEGGFYRYQRELWEAIADLNFCMYWTQQYRRESGVDRFGRRALMGRRHRLIGRRLNVATTIAMARYLEATIERLSRERFPDRRVDNFTMSYREGMAYRLREKLEDRRRSNLEREAAAQAEASDRAGVSTSTALTLGSVSEQEEAANYDFAHGEGAWAKKKARRAKYAEEARVRQEAYTAWAAANPEEARAEEEKREKAMKRLRRSASNRRFGKVDDGAFWAGADAANEVGIDPQAPEAKVAGRLS